MEGVAEVPPGLRVYAIGDVHGRLDLLAPLYRAIRADLERAAPAHSVEIFLGDYIDRGPQSRDVLEWLIASRPATARRVCLMGNHEAMLLDALRGLEEPDLWLGNGGVETMRSYGANPVGWFGRDRLRSVWAAFVSGFPEHHRSFLEGLSRSAGYGDYLFVHAGINPARSLADQDPDDLVWIREPFLSSPAAFGKIIVHGHTPVSTPDIRPNRINIDTGAVFTGRLTSLVLEGGTRRFMQTKPG